MQYAAHAIDQTPAEGLYGRGPTPEAAMMAARRQFAGATQYWASVKRRLVITEVADDFKGVWE